MQTDFCIMYTNVNNPHCEYMQKRMHHIHWNYEKILITLGLEMNSTHKYWADVWGFNTWSITWYIILLLNIFVTWHIIHFIFLIMQIKKISEFRLKRPIYLVYIAHLEFVRRDSKIALVRVWEIFLDKIEQWQFPRK